MERKAVVAGMFYEDSFDKLNKQIQDCFKSNLGPGDLPVRRGGKNIFGVISPHASYEYSGPCKAWSYKEIAENKFPSTFVILGPDHNGYGTYLSLMKEGEWHTPLGAVKINKSLALELLEKCDFLKENALANKFEYCIEVQVPFLQFANQDRIKDIQILPIIMNNYDYDMCKKLGDMLTKIDKDIVVIASSDFTHYGPGYGYMPFSDNKKENMKKLDMDAINFINKLDSKGFFEYVEENKATICGYGAIAALIEAAKSLGAKEGELLQYYTSGDIEEDYSNAVGYASVAFY